MRKVSESEIKLCLLIYLTYKINFYFFTFDNQTNNTKKYGLERYFY